jgi:2,3-dihydroxybiphenyl 1,2-dioxygenase
MTGVCALGYIGYDVTDTKAWDEFLRSLYGLELRPDSPRGSKQYRLDDRHHRISLYPARADGIRCIGWEVDSHEALAGLAQRLKDHGVSVRRGSRKLADERAVLDLVCFEDPDGFPMEIYVCGIVDHAPFRPGRPMAGFKTGPGGLGHVVLFCRDRNASAKWYQDLLGFRLSDYIYWGEAEATFTHCNGRHHSLAFVNECYGAKGGQFHHLMLEALSIDDVGRAYDIALKRGYPMAYTLGRHTNDLMTSFYMYTPSGHQIEYGYGGLIVDDATWEPVYYHATQLWGHHMQPPPPKWRASP